MEGGACVLLPGSAKITSSGLMCRSAMTLHKEAGERGQTGWIAAIEAETCRACFGWSNEAEPTGVLVEGSQSFVSGAMAVVAVQRRSGSAAECNVTASFNGSLHVTWVALVVIVHVLRAYG